MSFETMTLEFRRPSSTIFLGYNALVNTLCQLDRAFPQHVADAKEIPLHSRIRFYRNKLAEHWDAYTSNIVSPGFTFKRNKAPIPLVEGVGLSTERHALLSQLKRAFGAIGATLKWSDYKSHFGVSIEAEYGEAIFTAFEEIKAGLTTPSGKVQSYDDVIRLLLKFGFPAPILDIEEYALRLDAHLRAALATRP